MPTSTRMERLNWTCRSGCADRSIRDCNQICWRRTFSAVDSFAHSPACCFTRPCNGTWQQPESKGKEQTMESAVKILIVDDHEQNLTLLRVILQRHGYEIRLSRSGEEALQQVLAAPPDLI